MKILKILGRWIGYLLLLLAVLAFSAWGYSRLQINKRMNKVYKVETPDIQIPSDSESITRGEHLFVIHGCRDCHGVNLKGKFVLDDPLMGQIEAPNLTKGKGGIPADFTDKDWLRVLKHGLDRDGKPLIIMPAHETTLISDKDISEIIAYCKSVPPQNQSLLQEQNIGPLLGAFAAFSDAPLFPAEQIDHSPKHIEATTPTATAEYGKYLTTNCTACHQANFEGGPPLAPGYPPVPNITSKGRVGKWSEEDFIQTLRTGVTPEGSRLDSTKMPWKRTKEFSDLELIAVRKYLISLPKKKSEGTLKNACSNQK